MGQCACGRSGPVARSDGRCLACRGVGKRRVPWPAHHELWLKKIYVEAKSRQQFTKSLRHFMVQTGYKRGAVSMQAIRLGLSFIAKRDWTAQEDEALAKMAGNQSLREIARTLHRSTASISARMHLKKLRRRVFVDGFTTDELCQVLGVSDGTVKRWMSAGMLARLENRGFSYDAVRKFLAHHLAEVPFKRVDEGWLKEELSGLLRRSRAC